MGRYIAKYVKGCNLCNRTKTFPATPMCKLLLNRIPSWKWQVISVDLIVELLTSHRYDALLVVVDRVININILFYFIFILPEHFILNPFSRTIQPSQIRLQHLFCFFIINLLSHLALHKHFIIFYPTLHSCFAITLSPLLSPALTDIHYKPWTLVYA